MTHDTPPEDDEDESLSPSADPSVETPVEEAIFVEEDDSVEPAADPEEEGSPFTNEVLFDNDQIDFRGESRESLVELIRQYEEKIGPNEMDRRVRTVGSWENIVFRAIMEPSLEEGRIQEALGALSQEERKLLTSEHATRYTDPETNKVVLKKTPLRERVKAGETKSLSGDAARMSFETFEKGGGFRVMLYNSGISIDMIIPTGNDVQTLLQNCLIVDRQLGSTSGAHYFTYADLMYKTQIWAFLQPLIVSSSYSDWRKNGKLASVIKMPDVAAVVMTLAAMCWKDGYDNFSTKCTRPKSDDHPEPCHHVEKFTANLFDMVITRFSVMSKDAIDHMVETRNGAKHSLSQITKYQQALGLDGERFSFVGETKTATITFTARIPTLSEYLEAGSKFLSDIINEIEGDNTESRLEQFNARYIRSFLPWIASVEKKDEQTGTIITSEPSVIVRELEKLDNRDEDNILRNKLLAYVGKVQLTYVGYPVTPCPLCNYVADTPSGLWTIDPFDTFFTLALRYLRPTSSTTASV